MVNLSAPPTLDRVFLLWGGLDLRLFSISALASIYIVKIGISERENFHAIPLLDLRPTNYKLESRVEYTLGVYFVRNTCTPVGVGVSPRAPRFACMLKGTSKYIRASRNTNLPG